MTTPSKIANLIDRVTGIRAASFKRTAVATMMVCALCAVGGVVLAQNAGVDAPAKKKATIGTQAMLDGSVTLIGKMQAALKNIVKLQQVARDQKDVIKLNCVNDKLLQVKQLLNIADKARTNLLAATVGDAASSDDPENDTTGRYHEFGRITIAEQQVSVLSSEAENCIGEDLSFLGPTDVEVEGGNEPDDPTAPLDPEFPEIEAPPVASPFI